MIRELKTLTEKELSAISGTTIEIIEKIDAPYFIVKFTSEGTKIYKSNHEDLSDVDILMNSMYDRIDKLVSTKLSGLPIYNGTIGLWYFPTERPGKITYEKYRGKFMLGYADEFITQEHINMLYNAGILPKPIIARKLIGETELSSIKKYINGVYGDFFFLMNFLKGIKYFGTQIKDMEGVIFKTPSKPYQIILCRDESRNNDGEKKMYRDVILKDFISWYFKTLPYIQENSTYIQKVTDLFSKYSKWTEVVNKYSIEKDDLIPPHNGFIGDLCYERIPDDEINFLCRNDYVMKGIYKILLNSCRKELKKIDGDLLNNDDIERFNRIVKEIKEA